MKKCQYTRPPKLHSARLDGRIFTFLGTLRFTASKLRFVASFVGEMCRHYSVGSTRNEEHSMTTHRTNMKSLLEEASPGPVANAAQVGRKAVVITRRVQATADECFEAIRRHHERGARALPSDREPTTPDVAGAGGGGKSTGGITDQEPGDIIYGARAIAKFIFNDASDTVRRRVFGQWAFHHARKERAGFFKMKGALCLSKSQWRRFHGLD
jgi:hypothetical protein